MKSRIVLWEWLSRAGLEHLELSSQLSGWMLPGMIPTLSSRQAVEARYEVTCDRAWQTMRTHVRLLQEGRERSLQLYRPEPSMSISAGARP